MLQRWAFSLFFCAFVFLALTCCTTIRHPVEGVSRSSKPYCLAGTWHFPQNYYDYDRVGLASWYGPGFAGHRKASGEIYNQYAMCAAHKTLPLPSIVRVTNLENNKSVVVIVDDRGPFKYKGRIIDLSYAAARSLNMSRRGVQRVRVCALPRESRALAMLLKQRRLADRGGTWETIYRKEIGGRAGYANLSRQPPLLPAEMAEYRRMHKIALAGKKDHAVRKTQQKRLQTMRR